MAIIATPSEKVQATAIVSNMRKNMVKFGRAVFELRTHASGQTNRQTDILIAILCTPCRAGRVARLALKILAKDLHKLAQLGRENRGTGNTAPGDEVTSPVKNDAVAWRELWKFATTSWTTDDKKNTNSNSFGIFGLILPSFSFRSLPLPSVFPPVFSHSSPLSLPSLLLPSPTPPFPSPFLSIQWRVVGWRPVSYTHLTLPTILRV